MFHFLSMIVKIALASLLCGALLSAFDMSAAEVLAKVGMTPEHVLELMQKALAWALPNMVLGAMIIVPLWIIAYMLRPPRRS
ncbi:DUF6460 domain-containing protein [Oricola sp.]|uniref:DUF6460 domain-containing protein n=1 Tax=Oricola sp. TaxID=1979950 RepID=UPI0025E0F1A0|nr:DUF6460 domain-containing protein [Oricola sp.]MCI5078452.1 DUF6460 domain-containing protein [Oricola sp.]